MFDLMGLVWYSEGYVGGIMTPVKQRAFELLKNISDEKAVYVIKFIQAIEDDSKSDSENEMAMQSVNRRDDFEKRQAAFDGFMQYAGRLPPDFDYKADYIVTRNTEDFTNSSIPAISPERFLEL